MIAEIALSVALVALAFALAACFIIGKLTSALHDFATDLLREAEAAERLLKRAKLK